jgi:hypothetical protein
MKKRMKAWGLIGLALILTLALSGCPTDGGGDNGDGTGILGFGYHYFDGVGYSGIVVKVTQRSDKNDDVYTVTIDGAEVEIGYEQFDTDRNILWAGWNNDPSSYLTGQNYTVRGVSSPTGFTAEKSIAFDSAFDWWEAY